MTSFYVGQRVRLARPVYPENRGLTGRIRQFTDPRQLSDGSVGNCCVDWDNGDRDGITILRTGRRAFTNTNQLEPITPQGHRPAELTFTELMDRCRAGEGVCA